MKEMTNKQKFIYDYIKLYIKQNNKSPTFKEIGSFAGISRVAAYKIVLALEVKKYIGHYLYMPRTIKILK